MSKQYQVNLEQRLDQTDSMVLGLPPTDVEASVDLNSSIRTLNRVMSLPANPGEISRNLSLHNSIDQPPPLSITVTSQPCLTNLGSSPIRHMSGDAVALPTSPSPPSSLHGTPSSPSSMGEFSPSHAHNDPLDMPVTAQSAAAKRRAIKRSRKESVPDENKVRNCGRARFHISLLSNFFSLHVSRTTSIGGGGPRTMRPPSDPGISGGRKKLTSCNGWPTWKERIRYA